MATLRQNRRRRPIILQQPAGELLQQLCCFPPASSLFKGSKGVAFGWQLVMQQRRARCQPASASSRLPWRSRSERGGGTPPSTGWQVGWSSPQRPSPLCLPRTCLQLRPPFELALAESKRARLASPGWPASAVEARGLVGFCWVAHAGGGGLLPHSPALQRQQEQASEPSDSTYNNATCIDTCHIVIHGLARRGVIGWSTRVEVSCHDFSHLSPPLKRHTHANMS